MRPVPTSTSLPGPTQERHDRLQEVVLAGGRRAGRCARRSCGGRRARAAARRRATGAPARGAASSTRPRAERGLERVDRQLDVAAVGGAHAEHAAAPGSAIPPLTPAVEREAARVVPGGAVDAPDARRTSSRRALDRHELAVDPRARVAGGGEVPMCICTRPGSRARSRCRTRSRSRRALVAGTGGLRLAGSTGQACETDGRVGRPGRPASSRRR